MGLTSSPVVRVGAPPDAEERSPHPVGGESRSEPGEFLKNVHLFRGVAIVAVVATHVVFELNWQAEYLWEFKLCLSLLQNGTVLFVFVAGLLFQHLSHRFAYKKYLWSKCKFVILPYFLVSIPYVLLQYYRGFGIFAPWVVRHFRHPFAHALTMYVSGAQMPIPLWFIPMISVFYLAAPLLLWVDRGARRYWLIVPLLLLASFIHRPQTQVMLRQTVVYFLPVYLTGMWVSRNMAEVMTWTRKLRLPAIGLAAALVAYEVFSRQRPGAIESVAAFSTEKGIFDVNIYMKLLFCLVALQWLQKCPEWLARGLDPLARMSFGIFFVHFYFVYFARDLRRILDTAWPGTFLSVASYTLIVVVLSTLTVLLIQRLMRAKSRFIIGC